MPISINIKTKSDNFHSDLPLSGSIPSEIKIKKKVKSIKMKLIKDDKFFDDVPESGEVPEVKKSKVVSKSIKLKIPKNSIIPDYPDSLKLKTPEDHDF